MTTIVQILTQIFLRVVKLIFCFAFAPIPLALSVDDEGRGKAIQYFLFAASVGIEAIIIYLATNIYAIGLSGLSSTVGSTNAISTIVAMLFLNGMYLAIIQYASQFAEKQEVIKIMDNIEITVFDEINDYKEKIYFFNFRQWFFAILIVALVVPTYLLLKDKIGSEITSYIVIRNSRNSWIHRIC